MVRKLQDIGRCEMLDLPDTTTTELTNEYLLERSEEITCLLVDVVSGAYTDEHERSACIRMDKGKVNIAPPSRKAAWFHLVGVRLGNENEIYPHGDEVQAIEPWFPTDMWQDVSDEQMEAIIADIDVGMPDGARFSNFSRATTRAAWQVVVKHVPTKTEPQAKEIIAAWIKSGVLLSQEYRNEKTRKNEIGLFENKERDKGEEIPGEARDEIWF